MKLTKTYFALLTLFAVGNLYAEGFHFSTQTAPLDPRAAFIPQLVQGDEGLTLEWQIAPGYYLYRDKTRIRRVTGNHLITLTPLFAPGEEVTDPELGPQTIYRLFTVMTLPPQVAQQPEKALLEVTYQGCKEGQLCYPPTTVTLETF